MLKNHNTYQLLNDPFREGAAASVGKVYDPCMATRTFSKGVFLWVMI